jgi:hypothetical protein
MNTSDVRFSASPVYAGRLCNHQSPIFQSPSCPRENIERRGGGSVSVAWFSRPASIPETTYCHLVVSGHCRMMSLIGDLSRRGRRFFFTLAAKVDSAVCEMLVNCYRAVVAFSGGSNVVSAVMVQQAAVSGLGQDLRTPNPAVRCRLPEFV